MNNKISPTLFNPVALNIIKTLPVTADPCGKTFFGFDSGQEEHLVVGKVDYQINQKHSIFGRYTLANLTPAQHLRRKESSEQANIRDQRPGLLVCHRRHVSVRVGRSQFVSHRRESDQYREDFRCLPVHAGLRLCRNHFSGRRARHVHEHDQRRVPDWNLGGRSRASLTTD